MIFNGSTNLADVVHHLWKLTSMLTRLVQSLRKIGPAYMLEHQWIVTKGRVPNTLTKLLWERNVLSTPFNEYRAPKISCLFNDARLSHLQSMWRTWAPNIPVPTKEYLSSIPALWVHKEDLSKAIPLALIMI